MDIDELENRIKYHRPDQAGIGLIATMRHHALAWAREVRICVPEGREQALAFTKIEEALFWANAGIARDPEYWDPEQPDR